MDVVLEQKRDSPDETDGGTLPPVAKKTKVSAVENPNKALWTVGEEEAQTIFDDEDGSSVTMHWGQAEDSLLTQTFVLTQSDGTVRSTDEADFEARRLKAFQKLLRRAELKENHQVRVFQVTDPELDCLGVRIRARSFGRVLRVMDDRLGSDLENEVYDWVTQEAYIGDDMEEKVRSLVEERLTIVRDREPPRIREVSSAKIGSHSPKVVEDAAEFLMTADPAPSKTPFSEDKKEEEMSAPKKAKTK